MLRMKPCGERFGKVPASGSAAPRGPLGSRSCAKASAQHGLQAPTLVLWGGVPTAHTAVPQQECKH